MLPCQSMKYKEKNQHRQTIRAIVSYFVCLILVIEVLHVTLLVSTIVFCCDSRLPNLILRVNSFSILCGFGRARREAR
jgi:hypothetical protein